MGSRPKHARKQRKAPKLSRLTVFPAERMDALARLAAGESSTVLGRCHRVRHTTILRLRPDARPDSD